MIDLIPFEEVQNFWNTQYTGNLLTLGLWSTISDYFIKYTQRNNFVEQVPIDTSL